MFIDLRFIVRVLQRSAMCFSLLSYMPLLTERNN